MDTLDAKKPDWSNEPTAVDFNLINQPLEQICNRMISQLENKTKEPINFYFLLRGLLTTSFQTYKAIRKLVAEDPKYPAQAHILVRSLVDTLFNIVALTENPKENARKYEKAGYRHEWEMYEREKKRYDNKPEWNDWFDAKEKYLENGSRLFGLSENEKNNPTKMIKHWPNPSQLLGQSKSSNPLISLSPDKQNILTEVMEWRYGELSEWSHMGWGGMAAGVFATMSKSHWHPGKFESDAVYGGMLFLLMIMSEIESSYHYNEIQNLRYVWGLMGGYFEEAKDYYEMRYNNLLK